MKENNIITFSLWGNKPIYTAGAMANLLLAKEIYKDWKCRFYTDSTTDYSFLKLLHQNGAEIYKIQEDTGSWGGLFWRFYIANDKTVDRFIVRDTDSRLSLREFYAVQEWIQSGKSFHIMKDHPWQQGVPILGGMWGAKREFIKEDICELINQWKHGQNILQKGPDQFFLSNVIWPRVKNDCMIHDEISQLQYQFGPSKKFPTERKNYEFVGEIYDENGNRSGDAAHPEHWKVLKEFLERNSL